MRSFIDIVTLFEYREEIGGAFTHDGREYDLNLVLTAAETLPVVDFDVNKLTWILSDCEPDPRRVRLADLTAPVLVTPWNETWVIIDGLHRVARAAAEGRTYLPAKILTPLHLGFSSQT